MSLLLGCAKLKCHLLQKIYNIFMILGYFFVNCSLFWLIISYPDGKKMEIRRGTRQNFVHRSIGSNWNCSFFRKYSRMFFLNAGKYTNVKPRSRTKARPWIIRIFRICYNNEMVWLYMYITNHKKRCSGSWSESVWIRFNSTFRIWVWICKNQPNSWKFNTKIIIIFLEKDIFE